MTKNEKDDGCSGCFITFFLAPLMFVLLSIGGPVVNEWLVEGPQERAKAWNNGWTAGRLGMSKDHNPFTLKDRWSVRKHEAWNEGYLAGELPMSEPKK